jgi:hypothetical protein
MATPLWKRATKVIHDRSLTHRVQDDDDDLPHSLLADADSIKRTSDAKKMARILQHLFATADVAKKG